jgi:hypothetical protein
MSRLLKIGLIVPGFFLATASGYWYGIQRATEAYSEHFMFDAFTRDYQEAHHDLGIVRLLAEKKHERALYLAQYRYYSRLKLVADAAAKSSNPNVKNMLQASLDEAQELQRSIPFQFPTEKEQQEWTALTKPPIVNNE